MRLNRASAVLLATMEVLPTGGTQPAEAAPTIREFTVVAERFKFTPERIEVSQGDTVKITVRSADGTHGFEIKQFKVKQSVPKGGEPVTIEFVASQAGSFEIKCSQFCGTGHSRMKAVLVVKPGSGEGGTR